MNIDILRANPAASALLAGIGVNIGDTVSLAQAAQTEMLKKKTAEDAAILSGLISGYEAAAIANVSQQVTLEKQLAEKKKDLMDLARAKDYALAGSGNWPLKKQLGVPVPKDIKEAKLDEVPADWTAPAAAPAAPAAAA
jgi:hypothetical protein